MAIVKAKYLEALDKDTNQIVQVQMIPPEPEGSDLGGVTKEEKQKIAMDYIPTDGFYDAVEDGAGSHNSFFRGKNLGTQVTAQQYARMVDGTFKDLFIGDYWTLNETQYIIADFDYMYNVGDTSLTKHHCLIVPINQLYTHNMNDENVATGGYVGSKMYTEGLNNALTKIKADFGESHIVKYRNLLSNAVDGSGHASNWSWYDRELDIMNECMVYGHNAWSDMRYNIGCQKNQLALFRLAHNYINISRSWYWLRNVVSPTGFACVNGNGGVNRSYASDVNGVLPAFLIQ